MLSKKLSGCAVSDYWHFDLGHREKPLENEPLAGLEPSSVLGVLIVDTLADFLPRRKSTGVHRVARLSKKLPGCAVSDCWHFDLGHREKPLENEPLDGLELSSVLGVLIVDTLVEFLPRRKSTGVHRVASQRLLRKDVVLGTVLVDMYVKCANWRMSRLLAGMPHSWL
ncbi:hypothetical protein GOP47_0025807 [Adiantum capillus-veneris]|uniref:Uncharacterized protein n=1 Tax=Adiantum capillus-veneris TaxID=13818 RepID=A0A9D4U165_ADICA|nr:hypothetical protein GOP47_0025807 [Adiantum capillus-veneris]